MQRVVVLLMFGLAFGLSVSVEAQTKRIVQIEVAAGVREPVETQQKWMEILAGIGADRVRSRTSRSSGKVEVKETETSLGVLVKVSGVIQGNALVLPGKTFKIRDVDGLRDYVEKLRADGVNVALADKKAFGLTSEQLVELNTGLSAPLEIETKGKSAKDVLQYLSNQVNYELEYGAGARRVLAGTEPILDELKGLSLGTAVAAAIRPLGLVLAPGRKQGERTKLHIVSSRDAEEHWPVGWPSEGSPGKAVPKLFEKNQLEIREFPLDQVLAAIQAKAAVPMLFDYNSLARAEIEMSKTNVTFVKSNTSYGHSLRKILSQTRPRMGYEIRVDENGKPFLWVSTANLVK